jgi:hypothetical protein
VPWTTGQLARAGTLIVVALASVISLRLLLDLAAEHDSIGAVLLGFIPNDVVVWALALAGIWGLRRAGRRNP